MKNPSDENLAGVGKMLCFIVLLIAINKFSKGYGIAVFVPLTMYFFSKRQVGGIVLCYSFLTFLPNLTEAIVGSVNSVVYRSTFLIMTAIILLQASSKPDKNRLPFGMLYLYLCVALVSSIGGYCFPVSLLKLVNFILFLSAVQFCTHDIWCRQDQIQMIRRGFLAFAILVVFGSILAIPFPSIGYTMMINRYREFGVDSLSAVAKLEGDKANGLVLYSGIMGHSQALAPFLVCMATWVLCDMVFVERKFARVHLCVLLMVPFLLFKTRSRVGLLGMIGTMTFFCFYALPTSMIAQWMKRRIKSGFNRALLFMAICAVVLEVSQGGLSKWVRKTNDVDSDERDIIEAVTSTRQGAIELNLYDFQQNILFGTGFQVSYEVGEMYKMSGTLPLSAPIEKGLLPLMVLGETGVIGASVLFLFVLCFIYLCHRRRYVATLTLFCAMLICNMGEATFFSPTAVGGCFWIVACVGGFAIDMRCKYGDSGLNVIKDVNLRI